MNGIEWIELPDMILNLSNVMSIKNHNEYKLEIVTNTMYYSINQDYTLSKRNRIYFIHKHSHPEHYNKLLAIMKELPNRGN